MTRRPSIPSEVTATQPFCRRAVIPRYLVDTPNHYSPSCPSLPLQSLHTLGTFRFHPQFLLETLSPSAPRLQDLHVCGHHSHSLQETLFSLSTGAQGDDGPTNASLLASSLDSLLCIMPLVRETQRLATICHGASLLCPFLGFQDTPVCWRTPSDRRTVLL